MLTSEIAKHTAGPWQSMHDFSRDGEYTIVGNVDGEIVDGYQHYTYTTVAEVYDNDNRAEDIANARVIASAPQLLQALRGMMKLRAPDLITNEERANIINAAVAAIAKAEGR